MPHSLIWLPEILKDAGLKVAMVPGWEERGRGEVNRIFGVICHHTATKKTGNMPSLNTLINGRAATPTTKALPGPLSQLGLGRDGTFYVIAAGRCNHAGEGIWKGFTNGNGNFIGIEAENSGLSDEFPWPAIQMEAYHRGVAAILKHLGRSVEFCAGHKEYALPKGRKPDPSLDMDAFRLSVGNILNGTTPAPVLIPAEEPTTRPGNVAARPTLRRGSSGEFVKQLQTKLGVEADGTFGSKTEAKLRAFQRDKGIVPDGIVGPKTWVVLDGVI